MGFSKCVFLPNSIYLKVAFQSRIYQTVFAFPPKPFRLNCFAFSQWTFQMPNQTHPKSLSLKQVKKQVLGQAGLKPTYYSELIALRKDSLHFLCVLNKRIHHA